LIVAAKELPAAEEAQKTSMTKNALRQPSNGLFMAARKRLYLPIIV
jgi:hypothetical protein